MCGNGFRGRFEDDFAEQVIAAQKREAEARRHRSQVRGAVPAPEARLRARVAIRRVLDVIAELGDPPATEYDPRYVIRQDEDAVRREREALAHRALLARL